jgi:dTMP kinase
MSDSNDDQTHIETRADGLGSVATPGAEAFLPRALAHENAGKLIVVEGPDGSGRSTQIALLREWLEWRGYAVTTMGLKRSNLLGQDLGDLAKSNELQAQTRLLLYATDFYDQIERTVLPALRAGFIVLADRYTLTLKCRASVRSIATDYLDNLFDYTPEPDLCMTLSVPPEDCFYRLFSKRHQLSHWEFGGDLQGGANVYNAFMRYQQDLRQVLADQGEASGYMRVDGQASVLAVNERLREHVASVLDIEDMRYSPSEALRARWSPAH